MIFNFDAARSSGAGDGFLLRCLRREQFPLKRIRFDSAAKSVNGIDKLIDILKTLMHRSVTQVRDLIDPAQFLEHFSANDGGRNLAPAGFQVVLNFVHKIFKSQKTGRPFLKRFRDASREFTSVEGLMGSVAFNHAQIRALDFFIRGKPIFAFQTFATAADAGAIPRLTGIDDFVIGRPAPGATHSIKALISIPSLVASIILCVFLLFGFRQSHFLNSS